VGESSVRSGWFGAPGTIAGKPHASCKSAYQRSRSTCRPRAPNNRADIDVPIPATERRALVAKLGLFLHSRISRTAVIEPA